MKILIGQTKSHSDGHPRSRRMALNLKIKDIAFCHPRSKNRLAVSDAITRQMCNLPGRKKEKEKKRRGIYCGSSVKIKMCGVRGGRGFDAGSLANETLGDKMKILPERTLTARRENNKRSRKEKKVQAFFFAQKPTTHAKGGGSGGGGVARREWAGAQKEKYCKHEPAVIHITYSSVIHGAAARFYISIVPLRE